MSYSAFHNSATTTNQLAALRSNVMTLDADILWNVSNIVNGCALIGAELIDASTILSGRGYSQLPRCVADVIGLKNDSDQSDEEDHSDQHDSDHEKHPHENDMQIDSKTDHKMLTKQNKLTQPSLTSTLSLEEEAIQRLHSSTIHLVTSNLPTGVRLIDCSQKSTNTPRAALTIGVPNCWTADVILDSLKLDSAILVLLSFSILVGTHPDASSEMRAYTHSNHRNLVMGSFRTTSIRQMFQDRIAWRADQLKDVDKDKRAAEMLQVLCQAISFQCCGRLAMSHLRAQAATLTKRQYWRADDFHLDGHLGDMKPTVELKIAYWLRSRNLKGMVTIRARDTLEEGISVGERDILSIVHNTTPVQETPALDMKSLHLKAFVSDLLQVRATDALVDLIADVKKRFDESPIEISIRRSGKELVSAVISSSVYGPILEFSISLRSGGFRVRNVSFLKQQTDIRCQYWNNLQRLLWTGDRFFSSRENPVDILHELISCHIDLLKCQTKRRCSSLANLDANYINECLPKKCNAKKRVKTEAVLDKTVGEENKSPVAVTKATKSPPTENPAKRRKVVSTTDKFFIDPSAFHNWHHESGKRDEGEMSIEDEEIRKLAACEASEMAQFAEYLHGKKLSARRSTCLEKLSRLDLHSRRKDISKKSPYITPINVDMKPLDVDGSALILYGERGFRISMVLSKHPFDEIPFSTNMRFHPKSKLLILDCQSADDSATENVFRNLSTIKTSADIIGGLKRRPKKEVVILHKTPSLVKLKANRINVDVSIYGNSVKIEVGRENSIIRDQLLRYLEEVVNGADVDKGERLADLLDISLLLGLALQASAPKDPKRFRVRFSTPLQVRFVIAGANSKTHAMDIDARMGNGQVLLIDVARALASHSPTRPARTNFQPIPIWESMLAALQTQRYGTIMHNGAAINLNKVALARVLAKAVESAGL